MASCKDGHQRGAACFKAWSDLKQIFQNHQPRVHLSPDEVFDFRFLFIFILLFIAYCLCKIVFFIFNLQCLFWSLFFFFSCHDREESSPDPDDPPMEDLLPDTGEGTTGGNSLIQMATPEMVLSSHLVADEVNNQVIPIWLI